ncbi:MAG: prephenate dehydrogenase [Clostridiales bacterium]|jgi:prephenate dehydrogenase|nr:prephenate dehydrogenase [Eubacteriales bacterium]MDH7566997.1 prephenate dehydrogenase [Clostridiales bacterium]
MGDKKIAIIGLGLIGGSLAKALSERLGIYDITAVDLNTGSIEQAVKDKTVARGFTEVNEYVWNADIIFLCTPVKKALEYLETISSKVKPGCIVTDVCSTKTEILGCINGMREPPRFVGGHPMTGSEKEGYSASFAHLFENAYYILTPGKSTDDSALKCMTELVRGIGGIPLVMEAGEHDRVTGSVSHVPHIIAAALVNMVKETDSPDGKMQILAAGGFKDITRIASSSPGIWESIVLSNKRHIMGILDGYMKILKEFNEYMEKDDSEKIYSFFESSKIYRDNLAEGKKSLLYPLYEIAVDVVDKPGIIGEIATLLGQNGINIKNINVSNSREFEQGCLTITLPDAESENFAFDLLSNRGYKVYRNR